MNSYRAAVTRVVDGDTVEMAVEIWAGLTYKTKVRLAGVNCPEMEINGKPSAQGLAAKAKTESLVGGKQVTLKFKGIDKYGRTLGWVECDGKDLGTALVAEGHARIFMGMAEEMMWDFPT